MEGHFTYNSEIFCTVKNESLRGLLAFESSGRRHDITVGSSGILLLYIPKYGGYLDLADRY